MYVTAETELGTLKGQEKTTQCFSHKKYFSFQGIPYAKPPVGPLRFKDPEEPEPWLGIHDALKEGNDCSQIHMLLHSPTGSEDCLYLNVYTPQMSGNKLPVMVWVHGGAFMSGSGSSQVNGPDHLIEQNVVLVTINYRLHVLGFLCLDHEEVPGNAGLKDQVMAFKWVQKNIVRFGGDPNNVTIFGVSAGGACIHYHLLSPLSQGLFHHAIIQSGSTLNSWAFVDKNTAVDRAFRLGKVLGCDTRDTDELLQFLRRVPANDFVKMANSILTDDEVKQGLALLFVPCVEVPAIAESFLPKSPRELLKQGRTVKVPTIIGSVNNEGMLSLLLYQINEETIAKQYETLEKGILQNLHIPAGSKRASQVLKDIKHFYFNDTPITMENIDSYFKLYGDWIFDAGIDEAVRIMVENEHAPPVYSYEFIHSPSESFIRRWISSAMPGVELKGVAHGEDISVFFSNLITGAIKPNTEDEKLIARVTKIWATFAKTGNPNYEGTETKWEPVKKNNFCHLAIGKELRLVPGRVKEQRMEFWKQLYDSSHCHEKYSAL